VNSFLTSLTTVLLPSGVRSHADHSLSCQSEIVDVGSLTPDCAKYSNARAKHLIGQFEATPEES
jgi:hypothetical protein